MTVDLNADAGESFGPWTMGADEALFASLTSVNLACGFHAGDPLTMHKTVQLAAAHGVQVGAHPGFPDRVGFGRRDVGASFEEVYTDVLYQLGALHAFLRAQGAALHHVKAHGALYLKMMRDEATACAVAAAVHDYDASLPLVILGGPGGAVMARAAEEAGVKVVQEAFPDRAYLKNGYLASRSIEGAVIRDPRQAAARAVRMVTEGRIETLDGGETEIQAQTLCVHGDNPKAPSVAAAVRRALETAGVSVRAF